MSGSRSKQIRRIAVSNGVNFRLVKKAYARTRGREARPHCYRGRRESRRIPVLLTQAIIDHAAKSCVGAWLLAARVIDGNAPRDGFRAKVGKGLEIPRGQFNYLRHVWRNYSAVA